MVRQAEIGQAEKIEALTGPAGRALSIGKSLACFARVHPLGAVSGVFLVFIVIVAINAPAIAPYDHLEGHFQNIREAPSSEFWLGTDDLGRDMLSRIIVGARISLFVALMATLVGDSLGASLGIASGYIGGRFDLISQRILEMMMAFPTLIFAMVLLVGLGAGLHTIIIAIAVTRIPSTARVIRSVVMSVKEFTYVDAARSIGATDARIMSRHVFPATMAPFIILVSTHISSVILLEASLSFLGMGIPPPNPSWGSMLGGSVTATLTPSWWMVIFPGVAITVTVLAFNLLGDDLRDILDPRMRGT